MKVSIKFLFRRNYRNIHKETFVKHSYTLINHFLNHVYIATCRNPWQQKKNIVYDFFLNGNL